MQESRWANGIALGSVAFGADRLTCESCPPVFYRRLYLTIIKELVATGDSWVAIDADDKIVGYALAAMDTNTLSLVYLGVSKQRGISASPPHIEVERRRRANNHGRPF